MPVPNYPGVVPGQTVSSVENLRQRIERLVRDSRGRKARKDQLLLSLPREKDALAEVEFPSDTLKGFLDFVADTLPHGDVYIFGGVLRDVALFGKSGFNSDIDVVVEGGWNHCVAYLESLGAERNKFGGFRLTAGGWPIDIWNARETWAIKQGFVEYLGIGSLTKTTVLNWDAVLMNWRTRQFIFGETYMRDISERILDVVLEQNPNPLGMAVRVFRHLFLKDARKITPRAAMYLAKVAKKYTYGTIKASEMRSYGNSVVEPWLHSFFAHLYVSPGVDIEDEFSVASKIVEKELGLDNSMT